MAGMIPDGNGAMGTSGPPAQMPGTQPGPGAEQMPQPAGFSDPQLLEMWKRWKKECFDQRWIFERQWMRNIWYLLNRQWIYYDSRRGQWQDKRLAKWVPRPVTNILKEGVQSVRANFASINYGANARPIGEDNLAVITAGVADDYAPILHEEHMMDVVMNTFDFWMLTTGNAWLHTAVSYDRKNGVERVGYETCVACGEEYAQNEIADAGQKCPSCGAMDFQPTLDPMTGMPKQQEIPKAKGITYALSPFEIAFPLMYDNFEDVPYIVRMRWRDKVYYEQDEEMRASKYDKTLQFAKTPQERTMQIFKTLPFQSDTGITPPYFASGGANSDSEGSVEYDVWVKPCADFPEGQVIRIAGDANPTIIHSEKEGLPGPLPYKDAKGNPLFTFHMARYEHVGGRIFGSSLIDPAIQKQDQLNQLDSHILMVIGRMANPIWLEPKGAEVEKFTGEPGLVVKWNPLVGNGTAKPERIPGEGVNSSVFAYRGLIKQEAEELMGTFDIMKGEKPGGTEAYAAMSFLYERATGRHASAYKERGRAYKGWFKDALEIEREFGEESRTRAVMQPTKAWAFETFKKADLQGNVEIIIEDGTLTPKTSLGERAAIDHLAQLGLIDPSDPDQKIAIFEKFGQQRLMPSVDAQVQEAWMNMDRFEKFMSDPQAIMQAQHEAQLQAQQAALTGQPPKPPGPLQYKRWYNPQIHRNELIKWCLSDRGRNVFAQHPAAEGLIEAYLMQIDTALAQQQMGIIDAGGVMIETQGGAPPQPGGPTPGDQPEQQGNHGRAQQMANSNRNAGGVGPQSAGAGGTQQGGGQMKPSSAMTIASRVRAQRYLNQNGGA